MAKKLQLTVEEKEDIIAKLNEKLASVPDDKVISLPPELIQELCFKFDEEKDVYRTLLQETYPRTNEHLDLIRIPQFFRKIDIKPFIDKYWGYLLRKEWGGYNSGKVNRGYGFILGYDLSNIDTTNWPYAYKLFENFTDIPFHANYENLERIGFFINNGSIPFTNFSNCDFSNYNWVFTYFLIEIYRIVQYINRNDSYYNINNMRQFEEAKMLMKKLIPIVKNTGLDIIINFNVISMSISTTLPTGPSKVEIFDFLKELIMSGIFDGCCIKIADGLSERAYGSDFVEHLRTYKGLFNVEEFKKHIANRTQQIEEASPKMIEERRNQYEEYLECILNMVDASLNSSQDSEIDYSRIRKKTDIN